MDTIETHRSFAGSQGVYSHKSAATGTEMTFAVFVPDHAEGARLPVVWFLSGLTCTHANVMEKGEYRQACAELGLILVAPDTSPRGDGVANADSYDLGQGAGFYVDATQEPWAPHFKMRSYIEEELPALVADHFPVDMARQAITGHSMGGHGALTIGLRNPDRFRAVGAFSPIVAPSQVPWGQQALGAYLGEDRASWRQADTVALIEDGARHPHIRVDQGGADEWLEEQLKTHLLADAAEVAGQPVEIAMHDGYDHSYYFVSTFVADHLRWLARYL